MNTAAPDPSSAFSRWWLSSKYTQVVCPESGWEQIARDAWNAALSAPAAAVGGAVAWQERWNDEDWTPITQEEYNKQLAAWDWSILAPGYQIRALYTTPAAPVGGFVVVGKITGIAQLTGLYEIDWTDEGHKLPGIGVGMSIYAPAAQPSAKDDAGSDIWEAYKSWPEDIRAKLSCHDLRRMSGWAPTPNPDDWRIDTSAGGPILVYQNCSVIQDEQARYVLALVSKDTAQMDAPR